MNKIESIKKEDLNETSNVSSAELFGIKYDFEVPQFVKRADHCPPIDKNYVFDDDTTVAILLGLKFNKRVFLQGLHGCLLYTSPSPRDGLLSRMPSSA